MLNSFYLHTSIITNNEFKFDFVMSLQISDLIITLLISLSINNAIKR